MTDLTPLVTAGLNNNRTETTWLQEQEALQRMLALTHEPANVEAPEQLTAVVRIATPDGRTLLAIHADGRVEGSATDASEAARVFHRELTGQGALLSTVEAERDRALEALAAVHKWNTLLNGRPRYRECNEALGRYGTEASDS